GGDRRGRRRAGPAPEPPGPGDPEDQVHRGRRPARRQAQGLANRVRGQPVFLPAVECGEWGARAADPRARRPGVGGSPLHFRVVGGYRVGTSPHTEPPPCPTAASSSRPPESPAPPSCPTPSPSPPAGSPPTTPSRSGASAPAAGAGP